MTKRFLWLVFGLLMLSQLFVARVNADDFQPVPGETWHDFFCIGEEICEVGDATGDGRDDIIAFTPSGLVWVAVSTGGSFSASSVWARDFCSSSVVCIVGDFDGDGDDDIARMAFAPVDSEPEFPGIYVSISNSVDTFGPSQLLWHSSAVCRVGAVCTADDVDGDGDDDIIVFLRDSVPGRQGRVLVSLSAGSGFGPLSEWHGFFCITQELCRTGDVNGDERADILAFTRENRGDVWGSLSQTEGGFGPSRVWHNDFCFDEQFCTVADIDGDNRDDILAFSRTVLDDFRRTDITSGQVVGALAVGPPYVTTPTFMAGAVRHPYFCIHEETCDTGDFNGDGKEDLITFVGERTDDRRGDVLVALSDFGAIHTWTVNFSQLKIARANESGDEPYLITIGFRSRFSTRSSTQAFWNGALYELGEDLRRGSVLTVPSDMGLVRFPSVRLWRPADGSVSGFVFPEIVGVLVLAMESDACSWEAINDLATTIRDRMVPILRSRVEQQLPPPLGPSSSADASAVVGITVSEATTILLHSVENDLFGTMFDVANYLTCLTDPEDVIGYQLFIFPTVDPGLAGMWSTSPVSNVTVRALSSWAWDTEYTPIVFRGGLPLYNNSSGAEYHVSVTVSEE